MGGPAPGRPHPDGADLPRTVTALLCRVETDPHPRVAGQTSHAGRRQAQGDQRVDDHLLDAAHMLGSPMGTIAHRTTGYPTSWPGPWIGDVASPVHPDQVCAHRSRVHQHVVGVAVDPERVDGGCSSNSR